MLPSNRRFLTVSVCLLLPFVFSCATAHKRAKKFMEGGLYEEAITTYEGILAEDPKDADAQVGLHQAREGFISARLIDARKARMADNPAQSMEYLRDAVVKAGEWKMAAGSNASFTQQEETDYAVGYARARVATDVREGMPARSAWLLQRYAPVLQPAHPGEYEALRRQAQAAGKTKCQEIRKGAVPELPYYTRFVQKFCGYFGETAEDLRPRAVDGDYYRDTQLDFSQVSLPDAIRSQLAQALSAEFRHSGWQDASGKRLLTVGIRGTWNEMRNSSPVPLTHHYTEHQPYTVIEHVQRRRDNGETYTVDEPRTEYRDIPHEMNYWGTRLDQRLELALTAHADALEHVIDASISDRNDSSGIEHSQSDPSIGLYPEKANLTNAAAWMKERIDRVAKEFGERSLSSWIQAYCQPPAQTSVAAAGDSILHCQRQPQAEYAPFVEDWYRVNFGLKSSQVQDVFGK